MPTYLYSDRKNGGFLGMRTGWKRRGIFRGIRRLLVVIETLTMQVVWMLPLVQMHVKTYQHIHYECIMLTICLLYFQTAVNCFNIKANIKLPYDPTIPLLGIHTEETRTERDMCTPMSISALFTIGKTQKQPRCPSAHEWIRKLWYTYTMEYHSVIKKNTSQF